MGEEVQSSNTILDMLKAVADSPEVMDIILDKNRQVLPIEGNDYQIPCNESDCLNINFAFCDVQIENSFCELDKGKGCCNHITIIVKPLCCKSEVSISK